MEMETRYSPAWLPAALLAAVAIIGVLATALVVQKGKAPHKQQLVGDVVQQQHYEWKMVTTWPKNFLAWGWRQKILPKWLTP